MTVPPPRRFGSLAVTPKFFCNPFTARSSVRVIISPSASVCWLGGGVSETMVAVPTTVALVMLMKSTDSPIGKGDVLCRATCTVGPLFGACTIADHWPSIAIASSQPRRMVLFVIMLFAPEFPRWIPSALVAISRVVPGRGITCTWSTLLEEPPIKTPINPDA